MSVHNSGLNSEEYNYYVLPGFIARTKGEELIEVRDVSTDQWSNQTNDAGLRHMINRDGVSVSKNEALKTHEFYRKQQEDRE